MDVQKLKEDICDIGRRIYMNHFVAANDGNISVKVSENEFYCTPTGVSKGFMTPDMIIKVDGEGNKIEGELNPSSEIKMHLRVYQERPDVQSVVHAHPPIATSYASMGEALDGYFMTENITNLGAVPVAPYAKPSTDEVPDSIAPLLANHDAMLLANHGALTVGPTLTRAYFNMESLEMYAKTSLYIHLLGGTPDLSRERIDDLLELREKVYRLPGRHPGYVKYNQDKD